MTYCPRCLKFIDKVLPHTCTPHPAALEIDRLTAENEDMSQQLRKEQLSAQRFADENARLRKIASHVPAKEYIKAKEAAGFGVEVKALEVEK